MASSAPNSFLNRAVALAPQAAAQTAAQAAPATGADGKALPPRTFPASFGGGRGGDGRGSGGGGGGGGDERRAPQLARKAAMTLEVIVTVFVPAGELRKARVAAEATKLELGFEEVVRCVAPRDRKLLAHHARARCTRADAL